MKLQLIIVVLQFNCYFCIVLVNETYERMTSLDNSIKKMITDPDMGKGESLKTNIRYFLQALYEVRKEVRIGNEHIMPQAEKLFKINKPNFILDDVNDKLLMKVYLWQSYEVKFFHGMLQEVLELWISSKLDYERRAAFEIRHKEEMKSNNHTTEEFFQDWWGKWDIPELDPEEDIQLKNFKFLFE